MIRVRGTIALLTALAALGTAELCAASPNNAEIVDVKKIWDQARHNAFTDLIRHNGKWFCVFREGDGHVSPNGALRVLTSQDGKKWTSAALITSQTADLRDAKITVAPDGRLMLAGAGALHQPADAKHQSYIWYSDDGVNWGEAIPIGEPNFWIWRIVWHDGKAYGIGYSTGETKGAKLYVSEDGKKFDVLVSDLAKENYPNESALMFLEDGTALCVLRRDGQPDPSALLGTAKAPYTDWTWQNLSVRIGGPQMTQLPDGRFVVAGRAYDNQVRTALWWLEPKTGALTEIVSLPSGGDTSYPGLVFQDGLLWVSYYSSHEGKTSIYLARVELPSVGKGDK